MACAIILEGTAVTCLTSKVMRTQIKPKGRAISPTVLNGAVVTESYTGASQD